MLTHERGAKPRKWVVGVGLLAISILAAGIGATAHYAIATDATSHATPWYAQTTESGLAAAGNPRSGSAAATDGNAPLNTANALSRAFHNAAEQVLPAVVSITNRHSAAAHIRRGKSSQEDEFDESPFENSPFGDLFKNNPELHRFFREIPSLPNMPEERLEGRGSGVIVDPSGVILTNNHVVAGGGEITVRLHDGREFKGVDIKTDPMSDLAIVHVKASGSLPFARLGDSNQVDVGDWVLALGQPFGLEGTVTAGIISAKGRGWAITDRGDFIQTDAAINPGNSGGPLVTLDGNVIGINTAISSSTGGYQGVGFAIPIDLAKWVGSQLVNGGKVHRAFLGVVIQALTPSLAEQFKVSSHEGVLVTEVRADTPAVKAGVKAGDVILKFAGRAVNTPRELQGIVEMQNIGGSAPLVVLRDGKEMTLNVTCREMPEDFAMSGPRSHDRGGESSHFDKLGLQVEDLTPQLAEQLGVKADHGVAITQVRSGSPAERAGLSAGMVVTEVDRKPVKTTDDFGKAIESQPLEKGVLLLVQSSGGSRFVVIRME